MTPQETLEATKNINNIFDIKNKKGRPLTGNKDLAPEELNKEVSIMKT